MDFQATIDAYCRKVESLEDQLLIGQAALQEENDRLREELDAVYTEMEVLKCQPNVDGTTVSGNSSGIIHRDDIEESLRTELSAVLERYGGLQSHVTVLQQRIRQLQCQYEQSAAGLEESQEQLSKWNHTHEELHSEYIAVVRDFDILQTDHSDLRADLDIVRNDKRALQAEVRNVHQEKDALKSIIEKMQRIQAEQNADQAQLQQEREIVKAELQQLLLEKKGVDERVEKLVSRQEQLNIEIASLDSARRELSEEVCNLQAAKGDVEKDLRKARTVNANLELAISKSRQDNTKLRNDNKQQKAEMMALRKTTIELERSQEKINEQLEECKKTEERTHDELEKANKRNEELKVNLEKAEAKHKVLQAEVESGSLYAKQIRGDLKEANKSLKDASQKFEEVSQRLEQSQSELAKEQDLSKARLAQLKESQEQEGLLSFQAKSQEQTIQQLQQDLDKLQTNRTAISKELQQSRAQYQTLRKELLPLQLETERLRNSQKKLQSERNLLQHNLNSIKKERDQMQSQVMPPAVLPSVPATDQQKEMECLKQEVCEQQEELERMKEEREAFKRYCDWVKPDRDKLKEDNGLLRVEQEATRNALQKSESEKAALMLEIEKYLAAQGTKLSAQQNPSLILGEKTELAPHFKAYRERTEKQLAQQDMDAVAKMNSDKSMSEEELERCREENEKYRPAELKRTVNVKPLPVLTSEIHGAIAGFLAAENAFGSLANFNMVNRDIHHVTLPVLYETMVRDDDTKDYGDYGILTENRDRLTLPSGWAHTKQLFLSLHHQERIRSLVPLHAMQATAMEHPFLLVVFPRLRFHVTWYMRKIDSTEESNSKPVSQRECALVLHGPTDARVLHNVLTTLRLRYWPINDGNELTMGLLDGITTIRCRQKARIRNGRALNVVERYYNRLETELSLRVDFIYEDSPVRETLQELLSLLERFQPGKPADEDLRVGLYCFEVPIQVSKPLIQAICRMIPYAIPHVNICLSKIQSLTFGRIEDIFTASVKAFENVWHNVTPPQRNGKQHQRHAPRVHLVAFTDDDLRVDATINATANGEAFVANIQAQDIHGNYVPRSNAYPAIFRSKNAVR